MSVNEIDVKDVVAQIRTRPSMWVASRENLFREILDNAFDILLKTKNKSPLVRVSIEERENDDMVITIQDNGPGLPTDEQAGVDGILLVYTPFTSSNYREETGNFGAGTNGVGGAAVRALSKTFEVEVYKNGKVHRLDFQDGKPGIFTKGKFHASEKSIIEKDTRSSEEKKLFPTGTKVKFQIDKEFLTVFQPITVEEVKDLIKAGALLICSIGMKVIVEHNGTTETYQYDSFPQGFTQKYGELTTIPLLHVPGKTKWRRTIVVDNKPKQIDDLIEYDLFFGYADENSKPECQSFVNILETRLGGAHQVAFEEAIENIIENTVGKRGSKILKTNEQSPEFRYIGAGMRYWVMVRVTNPPYSGQSKESISTKGDLKGVLSAAFEKSINQFFQKNQGVFDFVVKHAVDTMRARELRKASRATKKSATGFDMPENYYAADEKASEKELFLVEGLSAAGGILQAKYPHQAILPFRGKAKNVWGLSMAGAMKNAEIHALSVVLGLKPGEQYEDDPPRIDRILIATDADPDGLDIATSMIAIIYHLWPQYLEDGRVYVCDPPLFSVKNAKTGETFRCYSEQEKDSRVAQLQAKGVKVEITRFKGHGELRAKEVDEFLTNSATRRLISLALGDEGQLVKEMNEWFDKKSADVRKQLIVKGAQQFDSEVDE